MEIGKAVAQSLTERGNRATVCRVEDVATFDSYDAVILGSAVYIGRPMTSARELAARLEREFAPKPVWVFASGLKNITADPLLPQFTAPSTLPYLGSRYPIFGGFADRDLLTVAERSLIGLVGASKRDERDFDLIQAWAGEVANHLSHHSAAVE